MRNSTFLFDAEGHRGLTPAHQFRIDFGEQMGVKQSAMFFASRRVDAIALTKRVERD